MLQKAFDRAQEQRRVIRPGTGRLAVRTIPTHVSYRFALDGDAILKLNWHTQCITDE
jgi:hypothetical protein